MDHQDQLQAILETYRWINQVQDMHLKVGQQDLLQDLMVPERPGQFAQDGAVHCFLPLGELVLPHYLQLVLAHGLWHSFLSFLACNPSALQLALAHCLQLVPHHCLALLSSIILSPGGGSQRRRAEGRLQECFQ